MDATIFPNISPASPDGETFSLEDSDDIVGMARQIVDGHHIGALATIDESGFPHVRWMSTLSCDDFPRIVTLTAPNSQKVRHIRRNPSVNWMFSNRNLTLVLNLVGHARILEDTRSIKRAWRAAKDKSHAFFLTNFSGKPGMVVIETMVERLDCTIPESGFKFSKVIHPAPADRPAKAEPVTMERTPPFVHCRELTPT
jgi:general stress protein 26